MPGRKVSQATEVDVQSILGMADEQKGRKCGWSNMSKGKMFVNEITRTRSFRSFRMCMDFEFCVSWGRDAFGEN